MQVWQIAAGERGRYYDELFTAHDVMFMGPGQYGHAVAQAGGYSAAIQSGLESASKVGMIQALATSAAAGDIVLLRKGYAVEAVGLVANEPYMWDPCFDDVYGWNLQHVRRVIWQDQLRPQLAALQVKGGLFGARKQIPTFTRVEDAAVLGPLKDLLGSCKPRALNALPAVSTPLTLDEFATMLFAKGLPNRAVDDVVRAVTKQRRLDAWYESLPANSGRPTEHEVVAHLILPLLLALGWSEQLLAVEWQKIDLAGFLSAPTGIANCVLVCEAKRRGTGMQDDLDQAVGYVNDLRLDACRRILLTEGTRFYVYRRNTDSSWPDNPSGYVNFAKPRTHNVLPAGTNAIDTILALTPTNALR